MGPRLRWGRLAALSLGALLTATGVRYALPSLRGAADTAALYAAMLTVPDATLDMLERRFAGLPQADPSQPAPVSPTPSPPPPAQESQPQSPPAPSASQEETPPPTPAEIPEAYRGDILEEDFSAGAQTGTRYVSLGQGHLNNYTQLSAAEIQAIAKTPPSLELSGEGEPLVLIMHTHATESYERYDAPYYDTRNTWRTTDNNLNVVAVGNTLAQALSDGGIPTLHDATQHDYPSYNGSYEKSAQTVQRYLELYPSIRVVIDLHRDATEREGALIKPVTKIEGKKAAQLMMIAGCDDGTMQMPHWQENLRFAALLQNRLEGRYPTLMRPLFFAYRKYNQDLTTGSLLFEFGSHGNTLEECQYTAQLVGEAMAELLGELR